MGAHGKHVYSKTWDTIVFSIIIVAFSAAAIYLVQTFLDNESFQAMIKVFDLSEEDVRMIPVGALLFFLFWKGFDAVVFSKYLRLHEEREAASSGAETSADAKFQEAQSLIAEFEQKLHAARVEFTQEKLGKVDKEKKASSAKVANAISQAEQSLIEHQAKIKTQADRIRDELQSQVPALTKELTEKIKQKPAPLSAVN